MLQETIFTALQAFFPDAPLVEPVVATSEEPPADEKKAKKPEKPSPRSNGVMKREYAVHGYHVDAQVSPEQLHAAVQLLDQHQFFLETITGVDWLAEQQMEAIYDFSNYSLEPCRVVIRTRIPRDKPELPTITEIYPGANWHERETHDFFGIVFTGHPHLIPLLLPEDADFHPLRKDYTA